LLVGFMSVLCERKVVSVLVEVFFSTESTLS
jgi:hypothetical protein